MKYLRYGLKALGWLALVLGVLPAIGLAALIAANWSDDALSEAAQQALHYAPPTEQALGGNGYLIVMGLDAPAEGDTVAEAMALGRKRLAREIERRRWVEAHGDRLEGMPQSIAVESAVDAVFPARLRCPEGEADCFTWFVKHGDEVQALVITHQAQLQRLAAAASAPQFNNPAPSYLLVELPPYARLVRAHELWLAQASLQWMRGQPQRALQIAHQAAQLRSRLASQSNSLIASMIALAMQHRELRWLSDASAHLEPQTPMAVHQGVEALLAIPPGTLYQALEGEKQYMASTLYTSQNENGSGLFVDPWDSDPAWWTRALDRASDWAYLRHHTLNATARNLQQLQAISALPPHQMEAAFSKAIEQQSEGNICAPWKQLRNVTGMCLATETIFTYKGYIQRTADMEGFRRLVGLQHRAATQRVALPDMPTWLGQSPRDLRNPYTLQPMQWDTATSSLVFEGRERQNHNPNQSPTYRIRLRY